MKVLLVSPFFEDPNYPLYMPSENLGLGYLASSLRAASIEVDIFDANMLEITATAIPEAISLEAYDLVGISASSHLLIWEAKRIAATIKAIKPSIHITLGGHFCTFQHYEILRGDPNIDSVVRGDGEMVLLELVRAVESGGGLRDVAGISYRSMASEIVVNSDRPVVDELDSLPFPARDTLGHLQDLGHTWPTQMTSSRGCYANCSFCDIRAFYGPKWRARSAGSIADELQMLITEYGSHIVRFTDDEFIGPKGRGPKRARDIADEIMRRNIKASLMIDARAPVVEEPLFAHLKQAGVVDCLVGIESGVDRILKLYNKGADRRHNEKAIEILRRVGITLNLAFIMFDPRMIFSELRDNYQFLLDHEIATTDSLKSWLWPLHGTPAMEQIRAAGLVVQERLDGIEYRFVDASVEAVFKIVSQCKIITFELERRIFGARKHARIKSEELGYVEQRNLSMWCGLLEESMTHPNWDDFKSVAAEAESIVRMLDTAERGFANESVCSCATLQ